MSPRRWSDPDLDKEGFGFFSPAPAVAQTAALHALSSIRRNILRVFLTVPVEFRKRVVNIFRRILDKI